MTQIISLNNGWRIGWTEFCGRNADPETASRIATIDAVVPGDVHLDLIRNGMLPDPFVGMNIDHALWMEQKDWWYRLEFPSPDTRQNQTALLVFHGLDTFATVWLNRQFIANTNNMFMRHEFDVTQMLSSNGVNELVVRLAATAYSVPVDPNHTCMTWAPERLFCRKAQMSFGWDIAPRLVTVGIWRTVELHVVDTARIVNTWITPLRFQRDSVQVSVQTEIECFSRNVGTAKVNGQIFDTPWKARVPLTQGRHIITSDVNLKNPPLWWPIGYGQPNLIQSKTALEASGRNIDIHFCQAGLRRIELVMEPQSGGSQSFRFRCNGKDMLVTGLNWTPLDAIFARITPEKITRTLESLAGIGCNMLRVWGGGIYEPDHFYTECSRLGIMIWQDFMMACGWYPQTDLFAAQMEVEANQIVRDIRTYPCLAIWSGDNEVDGFYPSLAEKKRLTRQTLASVCRTLDFADSLCPKFTMATFRRHLQVGKLNRRRQHHYDHGNSYRAPASWDIRPRFMSEFGHLSLPSLDLIRKYFPSESEWPLTNEMWSFHGTDTTRERRFRGPDRILRALEACGKPLPTTIKDAVEASQDLQAEAVCAWIEHYCEDPEFGGFMLWNVADCWPQQSDSIMDYLGHPKTVFSRLGPLFERVRSKYDLAH